MSLAWCRQWSGVNGVSFFAPQIFAGINALGSGNKGSLIAAIIVNGVQLIATIITVFIVDKVGRRVLLVSGSALGFAAEIAVAIVFATSASNNAINLPYGASIASIVLVSRTCISHGTPFATIVLHSLQRLVTKAYNGGYLVNYFDLVSTALSPCNSLVSICFTCMMACRLCPHLQHHHACSLSAYCEHITQPAKQGKGHSHDQPQNVRPCGQGHGQANYVDRNSGRCESGLHS